MYNLHIKKYFYEYKTCNFICTQNVTREDASTREDDSTSNRLSFFLRLTQKLFRYELKCVVRVVMEGEGEGGVSGRDKLCMRLILCVFLYVCVCVWEERELLPTLLD